MNSFLEVFNGVRHDLCEKLCVLCGKMLLTTTNTKDAQGTQEFQSTKNISLRDPSEKLCALCGEMFLTTTNTKDAQGT